MAICPVSVAVVGRWWTKRLPASPVTCSPVSLDLSSPDLFSSVPLFALPARGVRLRGLKVPSKTRHGHVRGRVTPDTTCRFEPGWLESASSCLNWCMQPISSGSPPLPSNHSSRGLVDFHRWHYLRFCPKHKPRGFAGWSKGWWSSMQSNAGLASDMHSFRYSKSVLFVPASFILALRSCLNNSNQQVSQIYH